MIKFITLLTLFVTSVTFGADVKISSLPLGSGSAGNNSFGKLNASAVAASNELVGFFASIPLSGTGVGTTVQLPSGPASWSGYHSTDCLWTTASASFADPSADASCTFTERNDYQYQLLCQCRYYFNG